VSRTPDGEQEPNQSLDSTLAELRSKGWRVAAHHEFELNNQLRTVWLFMHPCNQCIKAEGDVSHEVLVLQLALGDAIKHHCAECSDDCECNEGT
jgi:hypothetical protein